MARKTVKTVQDPAVAWAENLWHRLNENFIDAERVIIEIIKARAWEPLGYESFSKAWIDRIMSKTRISALLTPHVVYQMLGEGLTNDDVADNVSGVTPETVNFLRKQRDAGVPPEKATTTVREHERELPGQRKYRILRLEVDVDEFADWRQLAQENDSTVKEIAMKAVKLAFDGLRRS